MDSEPETTSVERAAKRQRRELGTEQGQHASKAQHLQAVAAVTETAISQSLSDNVNETADSTAKANVTNLLVAETQTVRPSPTAIQQEQPSTPGLSNEEIQKGMQLVQQMLGTSVKNTVSSQQISQSQQSLQQPSRMLTCYEPTSTHTEEQHTVDTSNDTATTNTTTELLQHAQQGVPTSSQSQPHVDPQQPAVSMSASMNSGIAIASPSLHQQTTAASLQGANNGILNPSSLTALLSSITGLASSITGSRAIHDAVANSATSPTDNTDDENVNITEQEVAPTGQATQPSNAVDMGVSMQGNNVVSLSQQTAAWAQLLPQLTGSSHSTANQSLEALVQQVITHYRGPAGVSTIQLRGQPASSEPGPIIPRSVEGTKLGDGRIYVPLPMVSKYFFDAEFPLHILADVYVNNELLQYAHPVKIARSINKTRKHGLGNHWVTGHQRLVRHMKDVRLLGMDAILASDEETANGLRYSWDPAYKLLPPPAAPAATAAASLAMLPTLATFTTNPLAATLQNIAGSSGNGMLVAATSTSTSRPAERQLPAGQQHNEAAPLGASAQSAALQALQQLLTSSHAQVNSSGRPAAEMQSGTASTAIATRAPVTLVNNNAPKPGVSTPPPTEQQPLHKETVEANARSGPGSTTTAQTIPTTRTEIYTAGTGLVNKPDGNSPAQGLAVGTTNVTPQPFTPQTVEGGDSLQTAVTQASGGHPAITIRDGQGTKETQQQQQQQQQLAGVSNVGHTHPTQSMVELASVAGVGTPGPQQASTTQIISTSLVQGMNTVQPPQQTVHPQDQELNEEQCTEAVDAGLGGDTDVGGLQPSQLSNNQLIAALWAQIQNSTSSQPPPQLAEMLAMLGLQPNGSYTDDNRSAMNGSVQSGMQENTQATQASSTADEQNAITNTMQGTAAAAQLGNTSQASTSSTAAAAPQLNTNAAGVAMALMGYGSTGTSQILPPPPQPLQNGSDAIQRLLSNPETSVLANGLANLLNLAALLGLSQPSEALQRNNNLARLYDGRIHVPLAIVTSHFADAEFPVSVQTRVFINGSCIGDSLQARIVKYRKHKRPNHFNYWITGLQKVLAKYNDVRQQGLRMEDGALRVDLVAAED